MKRLYGFAVAALLALVLPTAAWSSLATDYVFSTGTGSRIVPASWTQVYAPTSDDFNSVTINSPFAFTLGATTSSSINVSSNGILGLGTTITNYWVNSMTGEIGFPRIVPFWDDLYGWSGSSASVIQAALVGTTPNRIIVVEWNNWVIDYATRLDLAPRVGTFQARFYEGSNKIEFWYGVMNSSHSSGATIGIAYSSSDYLSVTPTAGGGGTVSSTSPNNSISMSSVLIPENTVYSFTPCQKNVAVTGTIAQGGTANMLNGDTLMKSISVMRGNTQGYTPLSVALSSIACTGRTYSLAITGANAADYQLSSTSGSLAANSTATPTITFRPSGTGVRNATLTVTDDNGFVRTFYLAATGVTRMSWVTNVPQGGSTNLASGDTLLVGKIVLRGQTQGFTPFTIQNTNSTAGQTPASVTYTINDPTGQFSIAPTSASLGASQSSTPTINFTGTGVGNQYATLTVNADGEIRTFTLTAFSAAPGGEFRVNNVALNASSELYTNTTSCVGTQHNTQEIVVRNTGFGDFVINDIDFYEVDTTYQQGTPNFPIVRDRFDRPVVSGDYVITTLPVRAPISPSMAPSFPIVIAQGGSRTLYITYVGQRPDKRYARGYIRTNGQNLSGIDTNKYGGSIPPTMTEGLLTFNLFGRATASRLVLPNVLTQKGFEFPALRVGDSVDKTITITNDGTCDLRINSKQLRVTTGDVNEFRIVSALENADFDFTARDFILTPGASDQIVIRFKPSRSGSRLATLWLQTNDSTIQLPGLTERGAYYLDLYGRGKAGLEARELVLDPVVIGGSTSGIVNLENTSNFGVEIEKIIFDGGDADQFVEDAGNAWPTLPTTVLPGTKLPLGVTLTPTGGAGKRRTTLKLITTSGDTIQVTIIGEAGMQTLSVTPLSLFGTTSIAVGQEVREKVRITNSGTLPVTLQVPTLSGDMANYRMSTLPRLTLSPGQTEYLEVTYAPQSAGTSSGQIDIVSNASATPVVVMLGGEAAKARGGQIDPTETVVRPGGERNVQIEEAGKSDGKPELTERTSGVEEVAMESGVQLLASRPNPAREIASIGYRLNGTKEVELGLYDASGSLVKVLDRGSRGAGDHVVKVDVSGLASGTYYYRLNVGGRVLTQTLSVVR